MERGRSQLEQQYGSDHATYQKHYSFQSLQESLDNNHDNLRKIGTANLELLLKCHEVKDGSGKQSLFLLDAYFTALSVYSEVEGETVAIKETIERMEKIEAEHGVTSNFTPQARIVQSQDLLLVNVRLKEPEDGNGLTPVQRKVQASKEPLEILYQALAETLRQVSIEDIPEDFKPDDVASLDWKVSLHPFLDKVYFQICKKSMYGLELEQA